MSDYDQKCVDLPMTHGKAVKMECLCGWSRPEYKNAVSPFDLSATYKITYEDGAEVVIGGLPAYALAQGSFWYLSDNKKEPESVFARDDRVLAYLARVGQILKREKPGECVLPSQDEAECIIDGMNIPFEALKYGSEWACKNMKRWVDEWSRRGLIMWDEEINGWRIAHKSLKEKWKCWAVNVELNATPKALSFDGKEFVVVDADHRKVKRIFVEPGVDVLLEPRNPLKMETVLTVEYEDATEHPNFYPWETLALGWVRCHTNDGNAAGFLCNKQVVAAVGRAIANLEPFLEGDINIPSEKEADEIIKKLGIPYPPISHAEAGMIRPCIKMELMKRWKKSGKLCQMKDGSYEIEKLPCSNNQERELQIAKSGKDIARETIKEEKCERRLVVITTKNKKSKVNGRLTERWPKNKAEHREIQMRLWGGEDGLKGFETRELKTSLGKVCTYYVKFDTNGRMRILDVGEDAPDGYYSQSSKYYVLKRNAKIAREYSTEAQQIMWLANLEQMKFRDGLLDRFGNRGLIRKIDGKYAEMNFGKSAKWRRIMANNGTVFPKEGLGDGLAKLKKPRYTMIIKQVKIKPGAWEACYQ